MFTDVATNAAIGLGLFALYGLITLIDAPTTKDYYPHIILEKPLSNLSDPVLQAEVHDEPEAQADAVAEPEVQQELQPESIVALVNSSVSTNPIDAEYSAVPYNHELWPSPRPVNFVKAIIHRDPSCKPDGRLGHVKAVDILANRAYMSRKDFLNTNPIIYSEKYMKGINALYLLKDSIDKLEYLLTKETYKNELHRVEHWRKRSIY